MRQNFVRSSAHIHNVSFITRELGRANFAPSWLATLKSMTQLEKNNKKERGTNNANALISQMVLRVNLDYFPPASSKMERNCLISSLLSGLILTKVENKGTGSLSK